MMKKIYILLLLFVYSAISAVCAQNATDFNDESEGIFVSLNDTSIVGLAEAEEWTIKFTDKDTLDHQYNFPIGLTYSPANDKDITSIDLCDIDSMLCQTPRTILNEGVYEITERHFSYIVGSDTMTTVVFDDAIEQEFALPRKGQKIICTIMRDFLPVGLIGKVENIIHDTTNHRITVVCSHARMEEIYKQYFNITTGSDTVVISKTDPNFIQTLATAADDDPLFEDEDEDLKGKFTVGDKLSFDCNKHMEYDIMGSKVSLKTEGNITLTPHSVITVLNGKSYTSSLYDLDITPKATLETKIETEDLGNKKQGGVTLAKFKIPTPVPGLIVNARLGFRTYVQGSLAFTLTERLNSRFTLGFEEKFDAASNDYKTYIIHKSGDGTYTGKNEGGGNTQLEMCLQGKCDLTVALELGLSLAEVIEAKLRAEGGVGMKADYKLNMLEFGGATDKDEYIKSDLVKNKYDILTQMNPMELYATFKLDAAISALHGWLEASLSSFGLAPEYYIPIISYSWVPFCTNHLASASPKDVKMDLKWERPGRFDNELGVNIKDISNYGEPLKYYPSIENINLSLGKLRGGWILPEREKKVKHVLRFADYKDKHFQGKKLKISPYSKSLTFGTVAASFFNTVYVPYELNLDKVEYNYKDLNIKVYGHVDPKIIDDPTQELFFRYKSDNHQLENKKFSMSKEAIKNDGTFVHNLSFVNEKGNYNLQLIANSITEKAESTSNPIEVKSLFDWTPLVRETTEIGMTTARFNGEFREDVYNNQNQINGSNTVIVGFEFAVSSIFDTQRKRVEQEITLPIFNKDSYYIDIKDLQPGTEYKVRAYVRFPNDWNPWGDQVMYTSPTTTTFTTDSYIQDMQVYGLNDFNYGLGVSIIKKYLPSQNAKITFEVSEQEDFGRIHESVDVDFADWEDFGDSYQITVNLKNEYSYKTTYYWRARLYYDDTKTTSKTEKFVTGSPLETKMVSVKVEGNKANFVGEINTTLLNILKKNENLTSIAFEYATSSDFKHAKKVTPIVGNDITVKATAENLEYDTRYYVRLLVEDISGQYPSNVKNFKTPNPYGVTTNEAVVEDATVILNATLHEDARAFFQGEQTKAHYAAFDVAQTVEELDVVGKYTRIESEVLDKTTGKYSATIILEPNTTYYCRAVVYADEQSHPAKNTVSFKTADFDPGLIPVLQKQLAAKKKALQLKVKAQNKPSKK